MKAPHITTITGEEIDINVEQISAVDNKEGYSQIRLKTIDVISPSYREIADYLLSIES
jgi:hypothetical protein